MPLPYLAGPLPVISDTLKLDGGRANQAGPEQGPLNTLRTVGVRKSS